MMLLERNSDLYNFIKKETENTTYITPAEIVLNYRFGDKTVGCYMNFIDTDFTIIYEGRHLEGINQNLIFEYVKFAEQLKKELEITEKFKGVHLKITGAGKDNSVIEYHAWYIASSMQGIQPELYSGIIVYCNNTLCGCSDNIILYGLRNIEDLKSRIRKETMYK